MKIAKLGCASLPLVCAADVNYAETRENLLYHPRAKLLLIFPLTVFAKIDTVHSEAFRSTHIIEPPTFLLFVLISTSTTVLVSAERFFRIAVLVENVSGNSCSTTLPLDV